MLRAFLTATAVLCLVQAVFAQELTAEQRNACMGDYEKYCKGVTPGRRTHHRLPRQGERQAHPGLQEGAGGGREEVDEIATAKARDQIQTSRQAQTLRPASEEPSREAFRRNFQVLNINQS